MGFGDTGVETQAAAYTKVTDELRERAHRLLVKRNATDLIPMLLDMEATDDDRGE